MSFRHLRAITRKEIQHIFRDRATFFLIMFLPVLLLLLMAYSLAVDLKHIPIAVLDYDRSQASLSFIQQVVAGGDLVLHAQVDSMDEIEALLMHGEVKAALIIDPAFGRDLLAMKGMPIQIIIDGTEPVGGGFAVDHIGRRAEVYINTALSGQIEAMGLSVGLLQPVDLRVRTWFNPGLKSTVSIIPGLISMIMGLPAMSVALTLAHEREHGTLEQLMVTPVRRGELMVGKMLPYVIIGMVDVILLPLIGVLGFDVPLNGSFALFFLLTVVFFFAIFGLGLIVGVFMPTQSAALALSFLVILFPGFFMTGIFFPIVSMPEIIRLEALFLPGTHYTVITRGIFLPGIGLEVLWPNAVMLLILGFAFTGVAALFFKKKLG